MAPAYKINKPDEREGNPSGLLNQLLKQRQSPPFESPDPSDTQSRKRC